MGELGELGANYCNNDYCRVSCVKQCLKMFHMKLKVEQLFSIILNILGRKRNLIIVHFFVVSILAFLYYFPQITQNLKIQ